MSYQVLARRWRPQKFSDLIGQDVVVRTLKNAVHKGNLAHAYLLCGIRGVGKTTIARLMAMSVNCQQPAEGEPCGICPACSGIMSGSNLDVQEMDAASHTGVDDVREILDSVRYPPATLKYKVYIIDEAHMLSKNAFNALLKTLEEPPARILFILATTEPEKLPVTVRSRCQRFDLRRLGLDEIGNHLGYVFGKEGITADADAVVEIARAADGSVRDALSLAERVLAYAGGTLHGDNVRAALGIVGTTLMRRLSDAVLDGDAVAAVNSLREAGNAGHNPRTLLEALGRTWHLLACVQVDDSLLGEEADDEQRTWLQAQAGRLSAQALDLRYQVLIHGLRDLALVDERMGAEMVLMRLCGLNAVSAVAVPAAAPVAPRPETPAKPERSAPSVVEPALHQQQPRSVPSGGPQAKAPPVAERQEPAPQTAQPATENREHSPAARDLPLHDKAAPAPRSYAGWQEAVEAYGELRPGVAALLDHVVCLEFGNKVRLALDNHQQRAVAQAERTAFAEWLGREIFWESRQGQEGETLSQARVRQARAEAARLRKQAEDDPHVQALMREMDATLVTVTPAGASDEESMSGEEE